MAAQAGPYRRVRIFSSVPRLALFLGGCTTALLFFLTLYLPDSLRAFERVGYDEMVRSLDASLPPPDVVVVDVDEASLAELGQWPWPRFRIAALIEEAARLGARGIALDFLFPEPDRLSLDGIEQLYRAERGLNLTITGAAEEEGDNDAVLAAAVARHGVVLSGELEPSAEFATDLESVCGDTISVGVRATGGVTGEPPVLRAAGIRCPTLTLAEAASLVAAANTNPDRDGRQRRLPLVVRSGNGWVPGLALATVMRLESIEQVTLTWGAAGVESIRVGDTVIPTDERGNLLLPYRGLPTERFAHVPARALLAGEVEERDIAGKVVLFGTSAGGLEDLHATPVMRQCPGVDLHALAIDAILREDFFVEPGWSLGVQALTVALAGLLVSCLVAWAPVWLGTLLTLVAAALFVFGPWYSLAIYGVYWSPLPGLVTLIACFTLLVIVRLRFEERRKELLRQSFVRYVSAPLVDEIIKQAEPVKLTGERRSVSILMSDIRGFTALSESMSAEDLVQFLNSYFGVMIDLVLEEKGTLDKFMGDAVLALFGAPISQGDDALRAVRVAVRMQRQLQLLNETWRAEGRPQIQIGVGVSTGEVVVGNIGSNKRLEYTAIGPAVNYAQRIESLTKELGADILISEATYQQVKTHVEVKRHGPLQIKGKSAVIHVYEVTSFTE